jgi:serine O-acetyltransferase
MVNILPIGATNLIIKKFIMNVLSLIRSDYKKHKKYGAGFLVITFMTQGFWATCQYRFAHGVYNAVKIRWLRKIFLLPFYFWQKMNEMLTGISIPASAKIGHSFYIGHFGGIILNSNTIMGANCNISQGVTIGVSGVGEKRGVPVIGDNVYIGANAVICGKIKVGNNVLIGACSMVNKDLPENSVAVGVPAQIISMKGSEGYI